MSLGLFALLAMNPSRAFHQGDCVNLISDSHTYQVVGIDDSHDRCWVRRWPLARHGCPVFEISLQQLEPRKSMS